MSSSTDIRAQESMVQYFPADIDSIADHVLDMDLYLDPGHEAGLVRYRCKGDPFSRDNRQSLHRLGIRYLYIPVDQHKAYRDMLLERLDQMYRERGVSLLTRMRSVRMFGAKTIENALVFPAQKPGIEAILALGRQMAGWLCQDVIAFSYLLDLLPRPYQAASHMVNVGIGCGLLAREQKIEDSQELSTFIQGGLLHDIGMSGFPNDLLNTRKSLEPEDQTRFDAHPLNGWDLLVEQQDIPRLAMDMIRAHHERPDGHGYPSGLSGERVDFCMRLCGVVDGFDMMSIARVSGGPMPAVQALRVMREGAGMQWDADLLADWIRVIEGLLEADPQRCMPLSTAGFDVPNVSRAAGGPVAAEKESEDLSDTSVQDQRRRYERFTCHMPVKVRFIRSGKMYPVQPDQWVEMNTLDISRGGMQLVTPWPLALNDLLEVECCEKMTSTRYMVQVVRVRRSASQTWVAGVKFLSR